MNCKAIYCVYLCFYWANSKRFYNDSRGGRGRGEITNQSFKCKTIVANTSHILYKHVSGYILCIKKIYDIYFKEDFEPI